MKLIIKRVLKDYDTWRNLVNDNTGGRKSYGSMGCTAYRNAKKPNEVYLVFDWDDSKPYTNYVNLPEVKKLLAETGEFEVIEVSESFHLDS